MIKALNIASQGLMQAESRATDIAKDILKLSAEAASFTVDGLDEPANTPSDTANDTKATETGPSSTADLSTGDYSSLIQQFADLRAEENAFKASAAVFKSIDETSDEALGSILDDKG
jgi:hypothetical protein